jgi:hypothetical protein
MGVGYIGYFNLITSRQEVVTDSAMIKYNNMFGHNNNNNKFISVK